MKKRDSNFELMRIFAMIFIISSHLCNSIFIDLSLAIKFNTIISKTLSVWAGNLGNYLFIFISGYFISDSRFSWKKVYQLLQVLFFIFFIFRLFLEM